MAGAPAPDQLLLAQQPSLAALAAALDAAQQQQQGAAVQGLSSPAGGSTGLLRLWDQLAATTALPPIAALPLLQQPAPVPASVPHEAPALPPQGA